MNSKKFDRKQLYRFLAESIGEKVVRDTDVGILKNADTVLMPYVDLGLPSGTLWAKCNLGADEEWEIGDKFAWGATVPFKEDATDDNPKSQPSSSKYSLSDEEDAAVAQWGGEWYMPSKRDFQELCQFTYQRRCIYNGVEGYLFFKLKNKFDGGKMNKTDINPRYDVRRDEFIFMPMTVDTRNGKFGLYWSKSRVQLDYNPKITDDVYRFILRDNMIGLECFSRDCRFCIRPVRKR